MAVTCTVAFPYQLPASVVITFSHLKELVLYDVSGMASLALDCPCLKKLSVTLFNGGLEDVDLHLPEAEEIILGSYGLNYLRVFAPRTQKLSVRWKDPMQVLELDCPAVVDLTLDFCTSLEDIELAYFVQSCPLVHTLTIEYGFKLTPEGLEAAMRGWSNLTCLSLRDTGGGSHITNLHASCPNLKSFSLWTSSKQKGQFTDAEEDFEMPSWVELLGRSLGALAGAEWISCGGPEFSAEVLIDVLAQCVSCHSMHIIFTEGEPVLDLPGLPFLYVSASQLRCFTLSNMSLSSVTCPKYSSWHQLEVLKITGCESLANVCLDCPNLKELNLR